MNISISIVLIVIAIVLFILAITIASYYKYLYMNLKRNFKKYQVYVDRKYIESNVILQNAICEALEQAIEKDNKFEIKAYTDLFNKIKRKW